MAERSGQTDIVACSNCKGFYGRRCFYRHKEVCMKDGTVVPKSIPTDAINSKDDQFSREILLCFRQNEVGHICRTDKTLLMIGRRLFQKNLRRVDKTMETKKSVMADMRILARMFLEFRKLAVHQPTSCEEMFIRTNFEALEQAIEIVSKKEGKLNYGMKNQIYYILKNSVQFIVADHLSQRNDKQAGEIEKFSKLLDMNRDLIFGDSVYAINLSRQEKLRMPEQQADEKEVLLLWNYVKETIVKNSTEFTLVGKHEFVELRDSVCARLTLFNAWRGGEPSRLKLKQLQDAWDHRWVDRSTVEKLDDWEKKLFASIHIAYQAGKGNHLVPLLIPDDLVKPLKILSDEEMRQRADVHSDNMYVFPMTGQNFNHVHGWASINKMCKDAKCEKPELLTASKQRHRISTIYSALDVPEGDREYFYKHMGHTKSVNAGTYQYPLPVLEITKVGKHLQDIDIAVTERNAYGLTQSPERSSLRKEKDRSCKIKKTADSNNEVSTSEEETGDSSEEEYGHTEKKMNRKQRTGQPGSVFFRWDTRTTEIVRDKFKAWIELPSGNRLPSKTELLKCMEAGELSCSYVQLRTKIMNEQNKQQRETGRKLHEMNMLS